MDGLECSEVNLSALEFSGRMDAEYYRKSLLKYENMILLSNHINLCETASFLIGPFGSAYDTSNYTTLSNYRYVRGQDVKPFILKDDEPRFIAKCDFERLSKYSLKEQDIMVSVVGTLGNACLVRSKDLPAIFSCKSTVKKKKKMNPYYLIAYLNSKYGSRLLLRKERGAIQKGLNLDDLKSLIVPVYSDIFQSIVQKSICNAYNMLDNSKLAYSQAEQIFLDELGMTDFTPLAEKITVKNFADSFGACGRLDAEYYQTKYDTLFAKLSMVKTYLLGDLVWIKRSIEPGSNEYYSAGIPFVRVSDLSKYGLSDPEIHLNRIPFAHMNLQPKKDTILLSKDGSVGIAYKAEKDLDIVTSGAILHLELKTNQFLPDYLTLVLNSLIVKMQAERDAGGSIIQHWKPSEIEKVIIPWLPIDKQEQISRKIQESFFLRRESKKLLDRAIQAVEMAIEKDEQTAKNWLSSFK